MAVRAILSDREKSLAAAGFLSALYVQRREPTARALKNCPGVQTPDASAQVVSSLISPSNPASIVVLIAPGSVWGPEAAVSKYLSWIEYLEYAAARTVQGVYPLVSERAIRSLRAIYDAPDWGTVYEFLSAAPFLEELLLEGHAIIGRIFGAGTKISLEIVDEPDAPGQVELFGFIHTSMPPKDVSQKLDTFDREWWITAVRRAAGKLNFSLRYE
jgi:hypothetical protein